MRCLRFAAWQLQSAERARGCTRRGDSTQGPMTDSREDRLSCAPNELYEQSKRGKPSRTCLHRRRQEHRSRVRHRRCLARFGIRKIMECRAERQHERCGCEAISLLNRKASGTVSIPIAQNLSIPENQSAGVRGGGGGETLMLHIQVHSLSHVSLAYIYACCSRF